MLSDWGVPLTVAVCFGQVLHIDKRDVTQVSHRLTGAFIENGQKGATKAEVFADLLAVNLSKARNNEDQRIGIADYQAEYGLPHARSGCCRLALRQRQNNRFLLFAHVKDNLSSMSILRKGYDELVSM